MKNKLLLLAITFVFASQLVKAQVPSYVPTNGLNGWWSFSGNANDSSTNANNGTVNGATLTSDRFGNLNSAYKFNGVNNYIQCTSNIANVDNISISGWAQSNSPLGGEFVQIGEDDNINCNGIGVGKGGTSNVVGLNFWNLYNGNNLLSLVSCVSYYDSGYLLNSNSWFNFVITKTNNLISYYVNGVLIGSSTVLKANNPINKIFFGTSGVLPYTKTFYNGNLDDIGIWNRALSQQEITNLYNGNPNNTCNIPQGNLASGMVAYYPFCGNANDESGNHHDGTVNGATLSSDRFGNANSSYNFTGTTNDITLANSQNLVSASFSVSAWCTIDNLSPSDYDAVIIGQYNGQIVNDRKWLFGYRSISSQRGLSYYLCDNSGNYQNNSYTLNWSPEISKWYHITWVFTSGNSIKTYINGVLNSNVSITLSAFNNISNTILTKIGNGIDIDTPSKMPWNGKIDDVGIWNRALTQLEVTELYTNNLSTNSFNNAESQISIYPNPTNSKISIDCGNQSNLIGSQVKITNFLGQEIYNSILNQPVSEISLSSFATSGLYLVSITDNQGRIIATKKIILQ